MLENLLAGDVPIVPHGQLWITRITGNRQVDAGVSKRPVFFAEGHEPSAYALLRGVVGVLRGR